MTIRDYVKKNFENCSKEDISSSINTSLKSKEEETLPGLGVLFELLWQNSSEKSKEEMVNVIAANI